MSSSPAIFLIPELPLPVSDFVSLLLLLTFLPIYLCNRKWIFSPQGPHCEGSVWVLPPGQRFWLQSRGSHDARSAERGAGERHWTVYSKCWPSQAAWECLCILLLPALPFSLFLFNFLFCVGVWPINNVEIVSGG